MCIVDMIAISIYMAAENGHLELVKLFIEKGAIVIFRYQFHLSWLQKKCHSEIVNLLEIVI